MKKMKFDMRGTIMVLSLFVIMVGSYLLASGKTVVLSAVDKGILSDGVVTMVMDNLISVLMIVGGLIMMAVAYKYESIKLDVRDDE